MTALRYLLDDVRCPQCKLQLFHSPETVEPPIVFCEVCLAGGPLRRRQDIKAYCEFRQPDSKGPDDARDFAASLLRPHEIFQLSGGFRAV